MVLTGIYQSISGLFSSNLTTGQKYSHEEKTLEFDNPIQ